MTPEGKVKTKVKAFLQERGVWFCSPVTGGYGVQGIPDLLCCWNGLFVALEIKAKGNRNLVTELQALQISQIQGCGGIAAVVDDVDQMKEVEAHVQSRLRSRSDCD